MHFISLRQPPPNPCLLRAGGDVLPSGLRKAQVPLHDLSVPSARRVGVLGVDLGPRGRNSTGVNETDLQNMTHMFSPPTAHSYRKVLIHPCGARVPWQLVKHRVEEGQWATQDYKGDHLSSPDICLDLEIIWVLLLHLETKWLTDQSLSQLIEYTWIYYTPKWTS